MAVKYRAHQHFKIESVIGGGCPDRCARLYFLGVVYTRVVPQVAADDARATRGALETIYRAACIFNGIAGAYFTISLKYNVCRITTRGEAADGLFVGRVVPRVPLTIKYNNNNITHTVPPPEVWAE